MEEVQDLRGFIACLARMGEIKEVLGADWRLEIGGVTELMADLEGPALLFDSIKDYPPGFRIISNVFRTHKRLALVLGLDTDLRGINLLDAWRKKFNSFKPVPIKFVREAPVLECCMVGLDIALTRFPAPIWHEKDGGRYLGTGSCVITKDPESGHINIGTYRCMIQGNDQISVKMNKRKDGRLAMEKYHKVGKPCPVAISLGHDPKLFIASILPLSSDVEEYEFAGWLRGSPFEVVPGPLTGLPIPANAEIILEGEIPPLETKDLPKEGPFGEWPGYYADTTVGEVPLMVVKRIYYRKDPILLGMPPLKPPNTYLPFSLGAATLWDQMEKAGVPDVKGVWGFVHGGGPGLFTVIAIRQRYAGHSKQAALVASGAKAGAIAGKFVIVVDDDVDITDPQDVIWAISTRCYVREGLDLIKGVCTSPADPAIPPNCRSPSGYTMDRVLIDACRPYQWIEEFPEVNAFSKEYKEQLRNKWAL